MRRFGLVLLALALAFPVVANAHQVQQSPPAAPVRDPQAMSVLQSALAAMGGQGAAALQDTLVQATTTLSTNPGGSPSTVTIKTKGANEMRVDGSVDGKTYSVIYNNGRELRSTGTGWRQASSANANHKRIEHLPALLLAYELARGDYSASYVAQETLNGRTVHHLRVARISATGTGLDPLLTRNSQIDLFVDTQTFLPAKIAYQLLSETDWRRGAPFEIYYSDYRTVNGLLVPFQLKYVFNGQPVSTMQVTSMAVNQGAQDSDFQGNQ